MSACRCTLLSRLASVSAVTVDTSNQGYRSERIIERMQLARIRSTLVLICAATPMFAAFDSSISVTGSGNGNLVGSSIVFTATGTAVLGGFGNGTFTASGQTSIDSTGGSTGPIMGTFMLDFTGGNTLTGTFSIPAGIVAPQLGGDVTASGSLTITGGTGGFAGTTGSFPKVTGSGRPTGLTTSSFQLSGNGSLNLGPTTAPPPAITAVLNGGSGDSRLSPGCVAMVSGTNLSGQSAVVQVSGKQAAVLNAAANALTIQIPVDAAAGQLVLSEKRDGFTSNNVNITLDTVAPAILPGAGALGSFFHLNGTAVSADSPATPGETIRAAAVCMGPTNPPLATGAKTPASPAVVTVLAPTVTVGGAAANVTSSVAEPNLVGIYSVYFVVPQGLDAKNQAVALSVTGKNSNVAQLAVGPAVPVVTAIVNGAGFGSLGTLAPGEFATLFGANFGNQDQLQGFPATSFNGVSVTFAGTAAPI